MGINFTMWRKAIWQLVKMDDKKEWDALDVVSKWLIATRSAVTLVTVYSCIIAGLLAWRDGYFSFIPWIILTIGLFIAHGTITCSMTILTIVAVWTRTTIFAPNTESTL